MHTSSQQAAAKARTALLEIAQIKLGMAPDLFSEHLRRTRVEQLRATYRAYGQLFSDLTAGDKTP